MKRQKGMDMAMVRAVVIVCGLLLLGGCDGGEAKKDITQTVEQAVGAETVKKGRQMERDVEQGMRREMERAAKGLEGGEPGNQGAAPKEPLETEERAGFKE